MNSLVPGIRRAIENCEAMESKMLDERNALLPALERARYLNASTIHLVEYQYNQKIGNTRQEIAEMREHLKELGADAE